MHQPIAPHSDPPFIPSSTNLVGLLGAVGDIDDLEGYKLTVSLGSLLTQTQSSFKNVEPNSSIAQTG
jgi:hypothetical protein